VALHNLPEGMAVGVVVAGWLSGQENLSYAGLLALSLGIAIQNVPEGAIISMPLKSGGMSRRRAFSYGAASGVVEPLGAVMTILPMIAGYVLAVKVFKIDVLSSLGSICGGMTSTPALGTLMQVTRTEAVAVAYAATYPLALIMVVLCCQFLPIFFG
jgi:zinc transporter ZupT